MCVSVSSFEIELYFCQVLHFDLTCVIDNILCSESVCVCVCVCVCVGGWVGERFK